MSPGSRGPVVVDTGVFAARLTPSGSLLAARYRPVLEGRPAVISFVTVAELGYGARLAGWGPGRLRRLEYEIARAEIVWPGPNLVEAYASLRTWCVRTGHGLGQRSMRRTVGWRPQRSGFRFPSWRTMAFPPT